MYPVNSKFKHKPGRFWGVIGRKNLPLGQREDREVVAKQTVQNTAIHAQVSLGEHATGKEEIAAQEPTVVARFYGQAVLQRRVLARTTAKIDRAFVRLTPLQFRIIVLFFLFFLILPQQF